MQVLKPEACRGCPFYSKSKYYVPDMLVPGATIILLAQNPGVNEENGHLLLERNWVASKPVDITQDVPPQPLIGATGKLLNEKFLPLSGLTRKQVSVGNMIRCRPGHGLDMASDELPKLTNKMNLATSQAEVVKAIRHCKAAHFILPSSVKTIIAMGNYAFYGLTGHMDIINWRGYVIRAKRSDIATFQTIDTTAYQDVKQPVGEGDIDIFATLHIASLFKGENKKYYHAVLRDFYKLSAFLTKKWPLQLPVWGTDAPYEWPVHSAFDTEYNPDRDNELIRWSLCDTAYNLYCVEADNSPGYIPTLIGSTVILQNALADITHLGNLVDMRCMTVHDLMLAHATLYTGEPHSLNYIASIFGAFNRYKHLIHSEEQLYSALDAYEPMHIWQRSILPAFARDKASYRIYSNTMLPLISIIGQSQKTGVRLNGERLMQVVSTMRGRIDQIKQEVVELTNEPKLNIGGSKRLREILYAKD